MAEMIWKIGIDAGEARKAGVAFKQAASGSSTKSSKSDDKKDVGILNSLAAQIKSLEKQRAESLDEAQIKNFNKQIKTLKSTESKLKGEKKDSAFSGGFMGGLLGGFVGAIVGGFKELLEPIQAIAKLLVMALFPIFKPFLILFLKVGLLLFKWLNGLSNGYDKLSGGDKTDGALKTGAEAAGAVAGGVIGAAAAGPVGAVIGATIGAAVGGLLPNALKGLENIWIIATAWADKLLSIFGIDMDQVRRAVVTFIYQTLPDFFTKTIPEFFTKAFSSLNNFGRWLWDTLTNIILAAWSILDSFGQWMWDKLVSIFTAAWEILNKIGQWISDTILAKLRDALGGLYGLGQWMYDTIVDYLKMSLSFLSNIGNVILDYVKSMLHIGGKSKSVNDAIITPNGDIIRTSPSDYLIATKTPGSLGGSSGGASTINVSINGGLITEDVAKKIGQIILKEVKRSGGY